MAEGQMPDNLARLWRLSAASRFGRPAVLDVERVVAAGVELADRHGLPGVTLPRIAALLGVTSMSLYRHVGSKRELLELMRDLAGGPATRVDRSQGWRAGLRQWAFGQREVFERHPWLAQLPVLEPPSGPNAISWMEECLSVLRTTGLDWGQKLGILSLLGGYVRNAALMRQEFEEGRQGSGLDQVQSEQAYARALVHLVDPQVFPETAQLLGSPALGSTDRASDGSPGDPDPDFTFGLDLILDGIGVIIRRSA